MLLIVLLFGILLGLLVCILDIVGECGKNRGRGYWWWLLLSIFFTPVIIALLLIALGDTDEKRKQKIQQEELWKIAMNENKCG